MTRVSAYLSILLCAFSIVTSHSAFGQSNAAPTVDSSGAATIEVAPEFAYFELVLIESGANFEASTQRALKFEENLRKAFEDLDLPTGFIQMSGVRIEDAASTAATVHARVRFAFDSASTPSSRARTLASIADRLRKAARSLDFEIKGPFFGVEDREAVEQEAIARATENALYKSDAVASLMNASIVAVRNVSVLDLRWGDQDLDVPGNASDLKRLLCTARVRVSYQLSLP